MIILEINHNDNDPIETTKELLPDYSDILIKNNESIVVSIYSTKKDAIEIADILYSLYNIENKYIHVFGMNMYDNKNRGFINYLLIKKYGVDKVSILNPFSDHDLTNNITANSLIIDKEVEEILNRIISDANTYNPISLKNELVSLKKWVRKYLDYEINPHIVRSINLIIRLCECELDLINLNGNIDVLSLSQLSEKNAYELIDYSDLKNKYEDIYSSINSHINLSTSIKKRIEYLDLIRHFRISFNRDLNSSNTPWLILWLTSLFLLRSRFYGNIAENSAALAMCIRALEAYSKASLITDSTTNCGFNNIGRFYIQENRSNRPVSGVGSLWGKIKDINILHSSTKIDTLDNLIKCRNQSTFGHGLSTCSKSIADLSYKEIEHTISKTTFYNVPNPRTGKTQWGELLNRALTNPLSETMRLLATTSLNNMSS